MVILPLAAIRRHKACSEFDAVTTATSTRHILIRMSSWSLNFRCLRNYPLLSYFAAKSRAVAEYGGLSTLDVSGTNRSRLVLVQRPIARCEDASAWWAWCH